jgi:hypothetical protein
MSIQNRSWVVDAEISTEVWQTYGRTIVPDLSDQAWRAVTIAFQSLQHIKGARAFYLSGVLRDLPISDKIAEQIDKMLRDVMVGREALTQFALAGCHKSKVDA